MWRGTGGAEGGGRRPSQKWERRAGRNASALWNGSATPPPSIQPVTLSYAASASAPALAARSRKVKGWRPRGGDGRTRPPSCRWGNDCPMNIVPLGRARVPHSPRLLYSPASASRPFCSRNVDGAGRRIGSNLAEVPAILSGNCRCSGADDSVRSSSPRLGAILPTHNSRPFFAPCPFEFASKIISLNEKRPLFMVTQSGRKFSVEKNIRIAFVRRLGSSAVISIITP